MGVQDKTRKSFAIERQNTLTFWSNLETKGKNVTKPLEQNGKGVCVGMKIPPIGVPSTDQKIHAYP